MPARHPAPAKGLRHFLDEERQRVWMEGGLALPDAAERHDSVEQRFQYAGRLEKLRRRPQAQDVIDLLRTYAATCLPNPRATERFYWSVSCLPSTDKSLARINASWMELFALLPDGDGLRARFILHLSDFTTDSSMEPDRLDTALLDRCVGEPDAVGHFFWKTDTFGVKVRGPAAIRAFMAHPHALRAIRRFNLTHMNRGRNAYQGSHCFSLADRMLDD